MSTVFTSSTTPVKAKTDEVLDHKAIVDLINEQLRLAVDALERKDRRQQGLKSYFKSRQPAGRIFGVTVETKDGDTREMACKFGVKVGQKNRGLRYKPKDHGTFVIYEMINQSTNYKRTLAKLAEEITDIERRLSGDLSLKKRARLEKALVSKKNQLSNPVLKPSYRSINIEGLKGLRIRGRRIVVEGCSD